VKYGRSQFLTETLKKGILRISPASSYKDPSLNYAQQDDELEVALLGLPSEVKIEAIDEKTGKSKGRIEPIGNVKFMMRAPTNYYACCLSLTFNQRLFGDFQADCALIIKDPKEFLD